jgi:DNA-directed RNA polymerase sigma subunit (sigma70/sigma32)
MADDPFLQALAALEEVIADNDRRSGLIRKRMARIRKARAQGHAYSDTVTDEDGPLIVQLLTESSTALDVSGANVRRAEAQALYDEGMTMEQIAEKFGVTRQRVSSLLREARGDLR